MAADLDPSVFRPDAIDKETREYNSALFEVLRSAPPMHTLSVEDMRAQFAARPSVAAPPDPKATNRPIPGPDGELQVRILMPEDQPSGVYLHFHGSGFAVGRPHNFDALNRATVQGTGLAVVSVYYRLAPEHRHPAAFDDAEAAAVWLLANAKADLGTDHLVMGGESAGACIAAATLCRLRDHNGSTGFAAASLAYGAYGGVTPSVLASGDDPVLPRAFIEWIWNNLFGDRARQPGTSLGFSNPSLALELPFYQDLSNLPPALFTIGTIDPLLDDSLFVYARWLAAGNDAELGVYPGGVHGFDLHPTAIARKARQRINAFLTERVAEKA